MNTMFPVTSVGQLFFQIFTIFGIRDFFGILYVRNIPEISYPRGSGLFWVPWFYSPEFGIFPCFGIFIPRIFAKSPQNSRDSGFLRNFLLSGYPGKFLFPGFGIFLSLVILITGFGISGFLSRDFREIPGKSLGFFRNFVPLRYPGNFFQGSGFFFRGMGYLDKNSSLFFWINFVCLFFTMLKIVSFFFWK